MDGFNLIEISRFGCGLTRSEREYLQGYIMSQKRWKGKGKQVNAE